MVNRRSKVPFVRSRSVVIEVTRNITLSAKIPSRRGPSMSKFLGLSLRLQASKPISAEGTTSTRTIVRRSCRSCRMMRAAVNQVRRRFRALLG